MKAIRHALGAVVGLAVLAVLTMLSVYILPARADEGSAPSCAGLADVAAKLSQDYGESVLFSGTSGPGGVVVFATPDGSTWTLVGIRPDGLACVWGAGERWRPAAIALGTEG